MRPSVPHRCVRIGRCLLLGAGALLVLPSAAHGQGTWDAILTIQPYPSPYYSDWSVNPAFASLTLINSTAETHPVRIHFNVSDHRNRIIVTGVSEPELIAAGATVIYDNPYDVAGSTTHDQEIERVAARTGRLPEGDYEACAVAVDGTGFVLAESCAPFSIIYPDPPLLLSPFEGERLEHTDPLFTWTPVHVPLDYELSYLVRVVEVRPGQHPVSALRENIPHFETVHHTVPSLRYPLEAQALEAGRTYAWSVQAVDQNGYAAAGNDGRSEIWTFTYDDGSGVETPGAVRTTLTLTNTADTGEEPPDPELSLRAICTTQDVGAIVMHVASPFGFQPFEGNPAELYRKPGGEDWWLFTRRLGRSLLMHGDCTGPLGGLKWVASRKDGRNEKLNEWLSLDRPPTGIQSIEYGLFVLAITGADVEVPVEFREGHEFLAGHRIKVLRGLNAFAVLNLHEHELWPLLERIGYDEKQIEVQGFIGFDSEASIGVGGKHEVGGAQQGAVNLETEQKFLTLRAALPERRPVGPLARLFSSMRLGVELEIGREKDLVLGGRYTPADSSAARDTASSQGVFTSEDTWVVLPKITHTVVLREDAFPRVQGSRELVASVGLSFERETRTDDKAKHIWMQLQRKSGRAASGVRRVGSWFGADPDAVICADSPETESSASLALEYAMEGDIVLGRVVIEEPKVEIKLQLAGDRGLVAGHDRDLEFAIAAVVRGAEWGENGIALGVTVEREKAEADGARDQTCSPRPRSSAVTSMTRDRSDAIGGRPADSPEQPTTRSRSDANADQTKRPSDVKWTVSWRVATEKMPLGDLLKGIPPTLLSVWNAITPR